VELREALSQIAEIRAKVAATEQFRGYRAVPVAATGVLAIVAATVQPLLIPNPSADLSAYLALWLTTAVLGASAAGVRIVSRDWLEGPTLNRELTRLAVGQFAPCLVAGALVTLAVARHSPDAGWMLPGLWQILFALGMFASCRLLPKATALVAVFYLVTGTLNLVFCQGERAFTHWAMGLPFGIGQLAMAYILYWNLERIDDRPEA
jgi:hypothetical protein